MDLAEQSGALNQVGVVGWFQPGLLPLLVPISQLEEDPDNVRLHPEDNLEALESSLRTFGQTKPVVVRLERYASPSQSMPDSGRMVVVAGNGTLRTAKVLGWTHLAAVEFAGPKRFADAYAIADNRIPELAAWDQPKLDAQLIAISHEWSSAGLEWSADAAGLDAEFANREREDREPGERSERDDDLPPAPPPATGACPTCRSKETVCAGCVSVELLNPLVALRELLAETPENAARLAADAWITEEQASAVLKALRARGPVLESTENA